MDDVIMRPTLLATASILLAAASLSDLATRTIPNQVCVGIAIPAMLLRIGDGEAEASLAAALLVFVLALVCWWRGWMGGGDVKLLAAATLLVSPTQVPSLLAAVALAGGALSVGYLALSAVIVRPAGDPPSGTLRRVLHHERSRISGRVSLPYGCAIAAGVFLTLSSN